MNKNITKYIAIAILLVPMVSFAEPAPTSSPASSPAQSPAPSTSESSSTATAAAPSTGESLSTASPVVPSTGESQSTATPATPSTGGSSSTAIPATPSTGGSSSTAINNTTPNNPPTNPSNGGSSSSSSSGSRAYIYGCPMLTSYLRYGANNDSVQVAKLQSFLSNYEKMNVSVTGIFDKQTENAVIAFQTKYSNDIMGPWNKTSGTGYVYITTLKKINNIACSLPLTLSTTEQAIINEVINKSTVAKTVIVTPNTSNQIEIKGNVDDNTTVLEIETESENTNVASVSKPSVINKFWNFIKSLF